MNSTFTGRAAITGLLAACCCLGAATHVRAHFPWLALDGDGHAVYFFGENPADRTYHLPESVAAAKVHHLADGDHRTPVELVGVDSDTLVGRRSQQKFSDAGQLQSTVVYGNYHGTKLTYSTQLILATDPNQWPDQPAGNMQLQAVLSPNDGGVAAQVFWKGKPLPGAQVQLFCEEGHEEATATTDQQGIVRFTAGEVEDGLNALLVGRTDKDSPGQLNGETYTGEAHYLTVTFRRK